MRNRYSLNAAPRRLRKLNPLTDWRDATDQIKRRVSVPYAMRNILRWCKRGRSRFDCGLCHGGGIGPVSVNEREFYCHHSHQGGAVIRLIELAHNCDFMAALKFLAVEARIELPGNKKLSPEERRRLRRESEERERRAEEHATAKEEWIRQESAMRLACRDQIHKCDHILSKPGWSWSEQQRARAAYVLLNEFLLPEYLVLSFAPAQSLAYVLASEQERAAMLRAIREAGGVTAEPMEGEQYAHFVEVVT